MKKINVDEVVIDGQTYVPKNKVMAKDKEGMPFVMIRTYSAGVHCGYLKERNGKEVTLVDSIRIWYWTGAASLSQLAMEGTQDIDNCKIAMPVTSIILTEAIEIIDVTKKAQDILQGGALWKI